MLKEAEVRLLDINTSNQIAAGEVVEKPASVVKELVENSLDAGADSIDVTVYQGGTEYIRVQDNGSGMSETNAKLALSRHATSKIRLADDLNTLSTLGFRGEALPSIASVSDFEILTRPGDKDFATSIKVTGGEEMECMQTGGPAGTTIIVKDLFFNVPARRKFLKTVPTEGRYISEMLTKIALARPDVRFSMVNNDKEVLLTPGQGELLETIAALYGKDVAEDMLPVELLDSDVEVTGYIGKPTLLKGNRSWQTVLVNGRSISSPMISKAIEHAYQSQIPKRGFAFAVLNIKVSPASIDVNVHPQKSEIKFSDESRIYKAVYGALSYALTKPLAATKINETTENATAEGSLVYNNVTGAREVIPPEGKLMEDGRRVLPDGTIISATKGKEQNIFVSDETATGIFAGGNENSDSADNAAGGSTANSGNAVAAAGGVSGGINGELTSSAASSEMPLSEPFRSPEFPAADFKSKESIWRTPYSDGVAESGASFSTDEGTADEAISFKEAGEKLRREVESLPDAGIVYKDADNSVSSIWPIGQVDKTFIIAQSDDCLYLIDQHAAHERILYDRLVATHNDVPAQQLLMPLYIDLQADEVEMLDKHAAAFYKLGVDITPSGETSVRVASLPVDIKEDGAEDFIREIATYLMEHREPDASELRQDILHMTACRAAIKAGDVLNMRQMHQIIVELCNSPHPFTCPHGRPSMIKITSNDLYKMFKRTGFNL